MRLLRSGFFVSCIFSCAQLLHASELNVLVRDARGAPVADAVVTVTPRSGTDVPATLLHAAPRTHIIDQKNETFIPYIEVFRPGDSVVFLNSDRTRHHAYSFAPARQFEYMLTPGESSPPLLLDKPGVIAVGCNIHDRMITYLYVSDAPFIANSGGDGHVRISDIPAGAFEVHVWHPLLRPAAADNTQPLTIAGVAENRDLAFSLSLLPDPRATLDRERVSY